MDRSRTVSSGQVELDVSLGKIVVYWPETPILALPNVLEAGGIDST